MAFQTKREFTTNIRTMTKDELKDYLVEEAEHSQEEVDNMSNFELVDAYLTWNGVIGFTEDIIDVVRHVYGDMSDDECITDIL